MAIIFSDCLLQYVISVNDITLVPGFNTYHSSSSVSANHEESIPVNVQNGAFDDVISILKMKSRAKPPLIALGKFIVIGVLPSDIRIVDIVRFFIV